MAGGLLDWLPLSQDQLQGFAGLLGGLGAGMEQGRPFAGANAGLLNSMNMINQRQSQAMRQQYLDIAKRKAEQDVLEQRRKMTAEDVARTTLMGGPVSTGNQMGDQVAMTPGLLHQAQREQGGGLLGNAAFQAYAQAYPTKALEAAVAHEAKGDGFMEIGGRGYRKDGRNLVPVTDPAASYTERNFPVSGDRIQRQFSRDKGNTWENLGDPYTRREADGGSGGLSRAQETRNYQIDMAREVLASMSPDDVRAKMARADARGIPNTNYDPTISRLYTQALTRKTGHDPDFETLSRQFYGIGDGGAGGGRGGPSTPGPTMPQTVTELEPGGYQGGTTPRYEGGISRFGDIQPWQPVTAAGRTRSTIRKYDGPEADQEAPPAPDREANRAKLRRKTEAPFTVPQAMTLPGIGEVPAGAVVLYDSATGKYRRP